MNKEELRATIAVKLGYHIVDSPVDSTQAVLGLPFCLIAPDGSILGGYENPAHAWENSGDWVDSIDSALKLPVPEFHWWELKVHEHNDATAYLHLRKYHSEFGWYSKSGLAEAICGIWLAYKNGYLKNGQD
jgi:hypothetical protein